MINDLPFKVVRSNSHDELLAQAVNLLIARGAYREVHACTPTSLSSCARGAGVVEKKPPEIAAASFEAGVSEGKKMSFRSAHQVQILTNFTPRGSCQA
jgi:hypothetical protein